MIGRFFLLLLLASGARAADIFADGFEGGSASVCNASWGPVLQPLGFTRAAIPSTWPQLYGGASFPTFTPGSPAVKVPRNLIQGLTFLGTTRGTYASVQFKTPLAPLSGKISYQSSQIPGTVATLNGAFYITISKCLGDLRYGQPVVDQVDSPLCKSMSPKFGDVEAIAWNLTGHSGDGIHDAHCGLSPNTTYYLNYVNANPVNGYTTGQHDCPNGAPTCGVQTKSN